jgi:outer membrane protein OmpA-like peptidoglycan-associated protein
VAGSTLDTGASGQYKVWLSVGKEEDMRNVFRMGTLTPLVLFLIVGCATKSWVEGTVGAKEAQINQRIDTVEGRVGQEAQRVDTLDGRVGENGQRIEGVSSQVKSLQTSVGEVGEVAKVARERGDTALNKSDEVNNRLTRLWTNRNTRTPVETFDVLFGFNRWDLSDAGQTALVSLVKELKENDKLVVELVGYADPTGAREYNIQLSQRRVEAVRRFLVGNGVDMWRIHYVGMGSILTRDIPKDKKRRVTVSLASLE